MSLGPTKGGVVRLAEPIDGKPLILGEGVETVLTVMEATGLPGWATLGTSGLVNLESARQRHRSHPARRERRRTERKGAERGPSGIDRARRQGARRAAADGPQGLQRSRQRQERAFARGWSRRGEGRRSRLPRNLDAEDRSVKPRTTSKTKTRRFSLTETGLCGAKTSTTNGSGSLNRSKFLAGLATRRTRADSPATGASSFAFKNSDGVEIERVVTARPRCTGMLAP